LSHIYTKNNSENTVNHNDISILQYDFCNENRENFEKNEYQLNKINIVGNAQVKLFNNQTEENEEYFVAAQNIEEQASDNHIIKISSNYIEKSPSIGINTIFLNENIDLKNGKSFYGKGKILFKNFFSSNHRIFYINFCETNRL